jgi:acyl-CoA dehydrogenase
MTIATVPVPFAEPPWLNGLPSAYYNDSHRKWQKTCREFVDRVMMPYAGDWEAAGDVPGMICLLIGIIMIINEDR